MGKRKGIWILGLGALVVWGCDAERSVLDEGALDRAEREVVYGQDDRQDVFAHPDNALRELTRASIVALFQPGSLDQRNPDDVQIVSPSLEESQSLCPGQRFAEQPAGSFCSGTLIDDDLVLTAGHCVTSQAACQNLRLVFNYFMEGDGQLARIGREEVYTCQRLVVQRLDDAHDYAILQLDRPVEGGHAAAPVRGPGPVASGDEVTCVGFPSGLPAKIDAGGSVTDPRAAELDFFRATTDTFGGNSGSGVFNADREVVGILVRGAEDYTFRNGCFVVNELPEAGPTPFGEEISYAFNAVEALCALDWPSDRLCPQGGQGDWCDSCQADGDCLADWTCQGHPANPDVRTCAAPCQSDGQCREDHACQRGRCAPRTSQECRQGDVWTISSCGQDLAPFQPCALGQVCADGACEDVIDPDAADLAILAEDIVVTPSPIIERQAAQVLVVVRNIGVRPLPRDTVIELFSEEDGQRVQIADLVEIRRDLAPGEAVEVTFEITRFLEGPLTIVAVGTPSEPDAPRNNEAAIQVTVADDDTQGPVITSLVVEESGGDGDGFIEQGEPILVRWVVEDPAGISGTTVTIDGVGAAVTLEGSAIVGPLAVGDHVFEVQSRDADNTPAVGPVVTQVVSVLPERPFVQRVDPFEGAQGVALTATVSAFFDVDLDPASVSSSVLTVTPQGGQPLAGSVAYDGARRAVVFTPAAPLTLDLAYEAVVFGVTDIKGDGLAEPYRWTFSTSGEPASRVALISAPLADAVVGGEVVITGTAQDPAFAAFALTFAPELAPDDQRPIGRPVFQPVQEGTLGRWDTSGLEGAFILTLTVVDAQQGVNIAERRVFVDNSPPLIANIRTEPGDLNEDHVGAFVVTARISDTGAGVAEGGARVVFQIEGGAAQIVPLAAIGGDEWRGQITLDWAQLSGTLLRFEIEAVDRAGRRTSSGQLSDFIEAINDPPRLLPMPAVQVPENGVASRALDLREFGRDDETPTEALIFSVRAVGAQGVEARLEEGRFVTVTARDNFTGATTVTVQVTDGAASAAGAFRVQVVPDSEAPNPNPARFSLAPALGAEPLSARMVAEVANDRSGVEYFFEETTGNPGADDSGWQASPEYVDEGLLPGTTYRWRVLARDRSSRLNETAPSAASALTTPGQCVVCEPGERRCGPDGGFQVCEVDGRGCSAFGAPQACEEGDRCDEGRCVASCQDECPEAGLGACLDGSSSQLCGDFDDDPCLEWSDPTPCGVDEGCEGEGICVNRCARDDFEPNDAVDQAYVLDPGDFAGLSACSDADWFSVALRAGETLVLTAQAEVVEVELALFDEAGESQLAEIEGRGELVLEHVAEADEVVTWRVQVVDLSGDYDLNVALQGPGSEACVLGERQCTGRSTYQECVIDEGGALQWGEAAVCPVAEVCGAEGQCRERDPDVADDVPSVIEDRFEGELARGRFEGCACSVPGSRGESGLAWGLLLGVIGLIWRRRAR